MRKIIFKAIILITLSCGFVSNNFGGPTCPDLAWVSVTITSAANNNINYNYTIKNIGTDTLFIDKIVIQNYTARDSSINSSILKAAGGAFIYFYTTQKYILPDSAFSSYFSANPQLPIDSLPYLVIEIYLAGGKAECTTDRNIAISKIQVNTKNRNIGLPVSDIIWDTKTKSFYLSNNSLNSKFVIYNNLGRMVRSGILQNTTPVILPLNSGVYFIQVLGDKKKFVRKIIID